jgi:hypothetical protein
MFGWFKVKETNVTDKGFPKYTPVPYVPGYKRYHLIDGSIEEEEMNYNHFNLYSDIVKYGVTLYKDDEEIFLLPTSIVKVSYGRKEKTSD